MYFSLFLCRESHDKLEQSVRQVYVFVTLPIRQVGKVVTILTTVTHLQLITSHPGHDSNLIISELLNVMLVSFDIPMMMSQPNILTVELLLDDVVPLPQTLHQLLVVGDKELDVLPILVRLLFETIGLNAFL